MLLRKHIVGGKIDNFKTYDYDRILEVSIIAFNDFGEPCTKYLILEIMGKHSNIILLNENRVIIDSVKRIDNYISSVREVMPGRQYQLPPSQNKISPENIFHNEEILNEIFSKPENMELKVDKFILGNITGFSPMICREICYRANIPPMMKVKDLSSDDRKNIKHALLNMIEDIINKKYEPGVFFKDEKCKILFDYHCMDMHQYAFKKNFSNVSGLLDYFYTSKDKAERLNQKKSSLSKIISNNIDRCFKKIGILQESLTDAAKTDMYKLYGELLTANIYNIQKNSDKVTVANYYSEDMAEIEIPLNPHKTPGQNAQYYYKKYTKLKSTKENAEKQLEDTRSELAYLEAVAQMLETSDNITEIDEIRTELVEQGYVKERSSRKKRQQEKSKPAVFKSSDGFEILVGKNNKQNDELTLKTAHKSDLWLHTKDIPGSHVIIRIQRREVPDSTIAEAAKLAAYFSKASNSQNVPVDYTYVKNVRKPREAKPGMVIYDNYHTIYVNPEKL
jgi:predicted ribosome quality control (RQC) complex YloA/Tae2 family protein